MKRTSRLWGLLADGLGVLIALVCYQPVKKIFDFVSNAAAWLFLLKTLLALGLWQNWLVIVWVSRWGASLAFRSTCDTGVLLYNTELSMIWMLRLVNLDTVGWYQAWSAGSLNHHSSLIGVELGYTTTTNHVVCVPAFAWDTCFTIFLITEWYIWGVLKSNYLSLFLGNASLQMFLVFLVYFFKQACERTAIRSELSRQHFSSCLWRLCSD